MIRVGMRIDNDVERVPIIGEEGEIAVGFFEDWINEGDCMCFFTPNQIGLCCAAVEFTEQHGDSAPLSPNKKIMSRDMARPKKEPSEAGLQMIAAGFNWPK